MLADLVVPGGLDLAGRAAAGGGDPDQVAAFVGEGQEQQAVGLVLPAVVLAIGITGATGCGSGCRPAAPPRRRPG